MWRICNQTGTHKTNHKKKRYQSNKKKNSTNRNYSVYWYYEFITLKQSFKHFTIKPVLKTICVSRPLAFLTGDIFTLPQVYLPGCIFCHCHSPVLRNSLSWEIQFWGDLWMVLRAVWLVFQYTSEQQNAISERISVGTQFHCLVNRCKVKELTQCMWLSTIIPRTFWVPLIRVNLGVWV